MNEQGSLFDDIPEARFWKSVVGLARKKAKERTPYQMDGETKDEYDCLLKDNVRLEVAAILRRIADDIENKTLERQRNAIDFYYKGEKYGNKGR